MQADECDKSLRPASFLTDSAALNDPAGPYAGSAPRLTVDHATGKK